MGEAFPAEFPTVFEACQAHGLDPRREPIPSPRPRTTTWAASRWTSTAAPASPACGPRGEVACTGVHGANRLASNSLLEALVFGARVARSVVDTLPYVHRPAADLVLPEVAPAEAAPGPVGALRALMWDDAGLVRTADGLCSALSRLSSLEREIPPGAAEARSLATVARLLTTAALARPESRGAHFRADHPSHGRGMAAPDRADAVSGGRADHDGGRGGHPGRGWRGGVRVSGIAPLPVLVYEDVVRRALAEDLGRAGDVTTDAVCPADLAGRARLVARAVGRIAGLDASLLAFRLLDPDVRLDAHLEDGDDASAGETIACVAGRARALLAAERTALNLLGHLSGIATATRDVVARLEGLPTRVAATRKTTPGLRALEKHAVRLGGGTPHRYGLDDAVLVKDNHVALAGGIAEAVRRVRASVGHLVKIEVEVDTLAQLDEALARRRRGRAPRQHGRSDAARGGASREGTCGDRGLGRDPPGHDPRRGRDGSRRRLARVAHALGAVARRSARGRDELGRGCAGPERAGSIISASTKERSMSPAGVAAAVRPPDRRRGRKPEDRSPKQPDRPPRRLVRGAGARQPASRRRRRREVRRGRPRRLPPPRGPIQPGGAHRAGGRATRR